MLSANSLCLTACVTGHQVPSLFSLNGSCSTPQVQVNAKSIALRPEGTALQVDVWITFEGIENVGERAGVLRNFLVAFGPGHCGGSLDF